ncbi:MAG: hypothetical protein ACE5KK_03335 [Candidatus Brocadiales bacterium]
MKMPEGYTCEVCKRPDTLIWPFPVNIKGKPTWACPDCYHKEHPGCMPVFQVKEVGSDAHLELEGVGTEKIERLEIVFQQGEPVFETVMELAREYHAGRVNYQKARKVLTSLGEGQEEWAREAIVNLCRGKREDSQLYSLGLRQTGVSGGKDFTALTLQKVDGKTTYGLCLHGYLPT